MNTAIIRRRGPPFAMFSPARGCMVGGWFGKFPLQRFTHSRLVHPLDGSDVAGQWLRLNFRAGLSHSPARVAEG